MPSPLSWEKQSMKKNLRSFHGESLQPSSLEPTATMLQAVNTSGTELDKTSNFVSSHSAVFRLSATLIIGDMANITSSKRQGQIFG